MKNALSFCTLGLAFALVAGCTQKDATPSAKAVMTFEAQTEIIQQRAFPQVLAMPGEVVPAREMKIASNLNGFVRTVLVQEGDMIQKGQLLAEIDPAGTEAAIAQAKARVTSAAASLIDAREDVERFRKLAEANALAKDQLRDAQVIVIAVQAELDQAQAEWKARIADLAYVKLLAPENAVVVERFLEPGDLAGLQSPVLLLQSRAPREIEVFIPVSVIDSISIGSRLPVKLDDGSVHSSEVLRIVPSADSATRRVKVRLALPPDITTTPGSYGQVSLTLRDEQAVGVLESAIVSRAGIVGVFVIDNYALARFRSLELGRTYEGYHLVLSGLLPGDPVILNPSARLHDGHKVVTR
ncbi:MAG: efflux RND transporter periplasmic adaptor subunit [Candidatus Thiodiazotropha sp. (ex Troendleina suluensis)]|nr:efflux RND transporter periplasmic adaptor subunit [Candidatus Thiodiazotropha sp. (ex Troendleina suluensis)]MCU7945897.1 efflux RND transporter periplasmic adaptor subunit [Candidatus Thiodiazotropha sp. (ex Cardiolucina cf. quadrata)]